MCPPPRSFPFTGPGSRESARSGAATQATDQVLSDGLVIDCDECVLQESEACSDCVVTYLCGVESESPVVVDLAEVRAMRTLGEAGLVPPLRHRTSAMRA